MPLPGIAHIVSDRRVSGTFARECEPLPEERPGDQLKMLRISGGHPSHTVATAGPATAPGTSFVSAHQRRFIVNSTT